MAEFTAEELLSGTLDIERINLTDIKSFCMQNGLEDYDVSSDKTKADMLNEIAELIDPSAGMTVKEYADANGMTSKQVQEITGLTHWKHNLMVSDIEKLTGYTSGSSSADEPTEDETETVSVGTAEVKLAAAVAKKPALPGMLARRQDKIKAAQAKTGNDNTVQYVNVEQYKHIKQEKLPGRLRRLIKAQEKRGGE